MKKKLSDFLSKNTDSNYLMDVKESTFSQFEEILTKKEIFKEIVNEIHNSDPKRLDNIKNVENLIIRKLISKFENILNITKLSEIHYFYFILGYNVEKIIENVYRMHQKTFPELYSTNKQNNSEKHTLDKFIEELTKDNPNVQIMTETPENFMEFINNLSDSSYNSNKLKIKKFNYEINERITIKLDVDENFDIIKNVDEKQFVQIINTIISENSYEKIKDLRIFCNTNGLFEIIPFYEKEKCNSVIIEII